MTHREHLQHRTAWNMGMQDSFLLDLPVGDQDGGVRQFHAFAPRRGT